MTAVYGGEILQQNAPGIGTTLTIAWFGASTRANDLFVLAIYHGRDFTPTLDDPQWVHAGSIFKDTNSAPCRIDIFYALDATITEPITVSGDGSSDGWDWEMRHFATDDPPFELIEVSTDFATGAATEGPLVASFPQNRSDAYAVVQAWTFGRDPSTSWTGGSISIGGDYTHENYEAGWGSLSNGVNGGNIAISYTAPGVNTGEVTATLVATDPQDLNLIGIEVVFGPPVVDLLHVEYQGPQVALTGLPYDLRNVRLVDGKR